MANITRKRIPVFLFVVCQLIISCNGQSRVQRHIDPSKDGTVAVTGAVIDSRPTSRLPDNVRCMLQDRAGYYWFGTNGSGLYCYDGANLIRFTQKDGLCSDYVFSVQEDVAGDLWLDTDQGLCRYDGKQFINYTDTLKRSMQHDLVYEKGGLLFNYGGIGYNFNGNSFSQFAIHPASYQPEPSNLDRPYGFYCTFEDRSGNLWFGTDARGVCRYDGKTFTYFADKGLGSGAVRTIFQDKEGGNVVW